MVDCINESSDVTAGHTSRSQVPGAGARIASARHAECHTSHRVTCHQSTNVMGPRFNSTCHGHRRREVASEEGRERDAAGDWMVFLCCCLLPGAHCSGNPPGMKLVTHHDKGSWISNIYTNRFSLAITFHKISFVDIIILNFISVLSCDVMRLYIGIALTLLHEQGA